jgi:two-component system phosphate regulon sensor histidine kinase PhoR
MRKSVWIWVAVTVLGTGVLGTLAGFWNYNLVKTSDLAKSLKRIPINQVYIEEPWLDIVLGSLGFGVVCVFLYLIFFKLIKEIRLNQAQSEFLARVSHELKTPISTIELTASMLRERTPGTTENNELWNLFHFEMNRLKGEVESLLSASVASERHIKANLEKLNLKNWLQSQLPTWKAILGQEATVDLVMSESFLDLTPELDSKLLTLVCQNLMMNSKKFALQRPEVKVELTVEADPRKKNWVLIFTDKGWGFKSDDKKNIFKRFYRTQTQFNKAIPGTGLGLYLVKSACRAMNLKVEASSPGVGHGARFEIRGQI